MALKLANKIWLILADFFGGVFAFVLAFGGNFGGNFGGANCTFGGYFALIGVLVFGDDANLSFKNNRLKMSGHGAVW